MRLSASCSGSTLAQSNVIENTASNRPADVAIEHHSYEFCIRYFRPEQYGWMLEEAPGMAIDLHTLDEHLSYPSRLTITRVSDERQLKTWLHVMTSAGNTSKGPATRNRDSLDCCPIAGSSLARLPDRHFAINAHGTQSLSSPGVSRVLHIPGVFLARVTMRVKSVKRRCSLNAAFPVHHY
jgi:hypothetical protein